MNDIFAAIKYVYYLNNGPAYDKVALAVLKTYQNAEARNKRRAVESLLTSPEYLDDPCAKIFRERLHIKSSRPSAVMFSYCMPKVGGGAPEWVGDHGWRLKKWPEVSPYIKPTFVDKDND